MKCLSLLFVIMPCLALSQIQLSYISDNYNINHTALINPALTAFDHNKWNVGISSGSIYINGDYKFLKDIYRSGQIVTANEKQLNNYYNFLAQKTGLLDIEIKGPSFSYQLGRHRIGFSIQLNGYFNYNIETDVVNNNPEQFANDILESPISASLSAMAWSEWAFNYSYRHTIHKDLHMSIGISPKLLKGYKASFIKLDSDRIIQSTANDSILVTLGNTQTYLAGVDAIDGIGHTTDVNGSGYGLDIGGSILIGTSNEEFLWKLGIGIINIGQIKYDRNSTTQKLGQKNYYYQNNNQGDQDIINLVDVVKQEIDFVLDSTKITDQFKVRLPNSITLYSEYGGLAPFFIKGMFIKRLKAKDLSINRPDFMSLTPRYEIKQFSIQVPISTYGFNDFNVGLSLRAGPVSIGSGQIINQLFTSGSWGQGNYYLSININSDLFN